MVVTLQYTSTSMEKGTVDAMKAATGDSLVTQPRPSGRRDTSKETLWVEAAGNDYYSNDDDNNGDNVLTSVLTQVRHAYVLPPATPAHGTM